MEGTWAVSLAHSLISEKNNPQHPLIACRKAETERKSAAGRR